MKKSNRTSKSTQHQMARYMKSAIILAVTLIAWSPESAQAVAKVDPALKHFFESKNSDTMVRAIVVMDARQSGKQLPMRYDRIGVNRYLRDLAARRYWELKNYIESSIPPREARIRKVHWINTSFTVDATRSALKKIAYAPGVVKIYYNHPIRQDLPVEVSRVPLQKSATPPYNFIETGLMEVAQSHPEITGRGVVLGQVDTGVDGKHPTLQGKILAYFDGETGKTREPYDSGSHGTHTAGTMIGERRPGEWIGVAPEARLLAAGPLRGYDDMLAGMEFLLDPDGDPNTPDMPRAVNNSWNANGAPDIELFYRAISAWEAAGILPVFSAGNSGPRERSITRPKEHPATFAVGALQEKGVIARFSSRGPATFKGKDVIKPEISAPGSQILSSVPGGRYSKMSGTSMAAPHVAGTTALLYQIDPALTPLQVKSILIKSSVPANQTGPLASWDRAYGYGKLNILNAVRLAMNVRTKRYFSAGIPSLISDLPTTPTEDWFSGPEQLEAQEILQLDLAQTSFAELYAFPEEWEGEDWLSPEAL